MRDDTTFPAERLPAILECDPTTGRLFWRHRCPVIFGVRDERSQNHTAALFNRRYAGREAFTYEDPTGYRHGAIFRRLYKAHRVVWAMAHGAWPDGLIDHINGIRNDNRLVNLRVVDPAGNARNTSISRQNTSGCVGVFWSSSVQKWQAAYKAGGRRFHVGFFHDLESAAKAVRAARKANGFADGHGRGGL